MSPLGDTPYIFKGGQEDLKRLFYSDPSRAFAKPITIPPGYGIIKAGTVMARIAEGNRAGQHIPYSPFDTDGMAKGLITDWRGFAYLLNAPGTAKIAHVTMEDSYKFAVDDEIVCDDDDQSSQDNATLGSIDRTTYPHFAIITVEGSFGSETLAKGAAIAVQTATEDPFVQARGILKATVDTGVGENAKGGQGALVIGNAMLYLNNLYCYASTDVLADMTGWREDDPYLII